MNELVGFLVEVCPESVLKGSLGAGSWTEAGCGPRMGRRRGR
jgi:hypothetical protein